MYKICEGIILVDVVAVFTYLFLYFLCFDNKKNIDLFPLVMVGGVMMK